MQQGLQPISQEFGNRFINHVAETKRPKHRGRRWILALREEDNIGSMKFGKKHSRRK